MSLYGVNRMAYNKKQLKIGTRIEMEHKPTFNFIKNYKQKTGRFPSNQMIATKIAENHLKEFPNYYPALVKMEHRLKKR